MFAQGHWYAPYVPLVAADSTVSAREHRDEPTAAPMGPGHCLPVDEAEGQGLRDSDTVRRDTMFYSDHVVFQVEKRLFKVPRRKFEQESEIFRDMFALPASSSDTEGSSDEHPLLLEGIAESEFRTLLRAMFEPRYGASEQQQQQLLSFEEWIRVLKLTTMWHFTTLRVVAVDHLTPQLQKGDSLLALARREKPVQLHEVEPLGIATVVKMAEVREGPGGNNARFLTNFETAIKRLFKDELKT
ncbi:hypothetical protein C8T65DRAFT_735661 [Cerioporus squamosus]|nr:hypothetical protein C8T65DRAFT_735661 [Cerioporus squamosus]